MSDTLPCDDKDQLVAFLYDEIDPVVRRRVEDHLATCAACAREIASLTGVRSALAEWTAPDAVLGVTIPPDMAMSPPLPVFDGGDRTASVVTGSGRRWSDGVPAWAKTAAAVLVAALGLSIANLQVRYGADGLVLTTGWMTPSVATRTVNAPAESAATAPAWRTALATLESDLRNEIRASRARDVVPVATTTPRTLDDASLRRIASMIEESEARQKRELALRLTQFGRDIEVQRRTDNRRNVQALAQFEGYSGAEMARQRQMMDYIMRVSAQQPPQK